QRCRQIQVGSGQMASAIGGDDRGGGTQPLTYGDAAQPGPAAGLAAAADLGVQLFSARFLLGGGGDAHRLVADRLAVGEDRRDEGIDPVIVTVLAAILD